MTDEYAYNNDNYNKHDDNLRKSWSVHDKVLD